MSISGPERERYRTVSQHSKTTYYHDDGRSTMVTHKSRRAGGDTKRKMPQYAHWTRSWVVRKHVAIMMKSGDFYFGSRIRDSANKRSTLKNAATVTCIRSDTRHRGGVGMSQASIRGILGSTPDLKISRCYQWMQMSCAKLRDHQI